MVATHRGALLQMLSVAGAGKWRASLGHLAGEVRESVKEEEDDEEEGAAALWFDDV